jgi:hypothetical protein
MIDDPQNRQVNLDSLLGHMAIHRGLITREQLRAALVEQGGDLREGKLHPRPLGLILVTQGFITDDQLVSLLNEQKARTDELQASKKQDSLIGRILVQKGHITPQQLNECLSIQAAALDDGDEEVPRIGALLIRKGYVTPVTIMRTLAAQQKTIVACGTCNKRFNVLNYKPSAAVRCPHCKGPLKPVSLEPAAVRNQESVTVAPAEIVASAPQQNTPSPQPTAPAPEERSPLAAKAETRAKTEGKTRARAETRARARTEPGIPPGRKPKPKPKRKPKRAPRNTPT